MKKLILVLGLALSINQLALAGEPNCVGSINALRSPLAKSTSWSTLGVVLIDKGQRTLTQSGELVAGAKVTYSSQVCNHYNYSLAYTGVTTSKEDTANLELAKYLLASTPVLAKDKEVSAIIAAIVTAQQANQPSEDGVFYLSCGEDAVCTVDATKANEIQVSYLLAL